MGPKVSIIVPIYNVESFIEDCLQSIFDQSYPNIEIILVDDCSPDNSMVHVEKQLLRLRSKFEVQIIRHTTNSGLSATRNTGVRIATGEYLYFLDSDDIIEAQVIERLVESIMQTPDRKVDFAIGTMVVQGKNIKYPLDIDTYLSDNNHIMHSFMLGQWYVMAVNKLLNKQFFTQHNLWFEEGLLHEDILFSFRLAYSANTASSAQGANYVYKIRTSGSITAVKKLKNLQDELYINKLNFAAINSRYTVQSQLPIYFYCLQTTYTYMYLIALSKISSLDKKRLHKEAQALWNSMHPYSATSKLDLGSKVKSLILSLPRPLGVIWFRFHNVFLKLRQ